MKLTKLIVLLCLPFFSFAQSKTFEIYGTVVGNYNSKVYLFFENNFKSRDSISAPIKNRNFYFKGSFSKYPILAQLHLADQISHVADVFIDGGKVYVTCSNRILIQKNQDNSLDTINVFKTTPK